MKKVLISFLVFFGSSSLQAWGLGDYLSFRGLSRCASAVSYTGSLGLSAVKFLPRSCGNLYSMFTDFWCAGLAARLAKDRDAYAEQLKQKFSQAAEGKAHEVRDDLVGRVSRLGEEVKQGVQGVDALNARVVGLAATVAAMPDPQALVEDLDVQGRKVQRTLGAAQEQATIIAELTRINGALDGATADMSLTESMGLLVCPRSLLDRRFGRECRSDISRMMSADYISVE